MQRHWFFSDTVNDTVNCYHYFQQYVPKSYMLPPLCAVEESSPKKVSRDKKAIYTEAFSTAFLKIMKTFSCSVTGEPISNLCSQTVRRALVILTPQCGESL